jgi:hypothetical protein
MTCLQRAEAGEIERQIGQLVRVAVVAAVFFVQVTA